MSGDTQNAWIRGDLIIEAQTLEEAEAEAVRCYPNEACGFLIGPASETPSVNECVNEVNEADKYHALDPEHFPRTAKTYFKINELRAARAFEAGAKAGRPIKVIYHSHCDAGAHFSGEDSATFASAGTLMWPCSFLVISVVGGKVVDKKLWAHTPGTDDFHEARFTTR
ncbi:MAG: Mov34/MPN/PAD-1 family protein [Sandaracinaceae bacterium]|nr:Mov34/MPN/PAD-1 family protein [Sandaracinaceae bacterium]